MFNKLIDFSYKRSGKEALGFYLAYLLLSILLGGLVGGVYGLVVGIKGPEGFQTGIRAGHVISILLIIMLSVVILCKQKLSAHFVCWLLALAAVALTLFFGVIFGLIPLAFLTTRKNKS